MQDADWLYNGTTFFRREYGRTFTVIPNSSPILGGIHPERLVKVYYYDKEKVSLFVERICKPLRYSPELFWYKGAQYEHGKPSNTREETFLVQSYSVPSLQHKVTLRNTAKKNDEFATMLDFFRNQDYICICPRGTETDKICAMPHEACEKWGITRQEWMESQRKSKIYGEKVCHHVAEAYVLHGVYPFFDEAKIAFLFPKIMEAVMQLPSSFTEEELDVQLGQFRDDLGLSAAWRAFSRFDSEKQKKIRREEERRWYVQSLREELYRMPRL